MNYSHVGKKVEIADATLAVEFTSGDSGEYGFRARGRVFLRDGTLGRGVATFWLSADEAKQIAKERAK